VKTQNDLLQSQVASMRKEGEKVVPPPRPSLGGSSKSPSQQLIDKKATEPEFQRTGDAVGTISINLRSDPVEFHERLGGGGSGAQVFRCSVKGLSFAAKVLDMSHAQPSEIEPILKEITIMTELKHDNIVRYIGSECNGAKKEVRLYMELYSGTLRDVIDKHMETKLPFARKEISEYSLQIAKGLHYLHGLGIIHRDLKVCMLFISHATFADCHPMKQSDNIFVTWVRHIHWSTVQTTNHGQISGWTKESQDAKDWRLRCVEDSRQRKDFIHAKRRNTYPCCTWPLFRTLHVIFFP
jgi:serine/threonine protein kinase